MSNQIINWLSGGTTTDGFLMPDVNGSIQLVDIGLGKVHPFQVDHTYSGAVASVGLLKFAKATYEKGREILVRKNQATNWFIIDRLGKLEIEQGEGFEPEVLRLIKRYQSTEANGKLLLVIPDFLLARAIDKYDLQGCNILKGALPILQ